MTTPETPQLPDHIRELQEHKTAEFIAQGLFTMVVTDKPGIVYPAHAHEATTLVTLAGSALIKLGDNTEWQPVRPEDITEIADGQTHAALAGPQGWTYLFACSYEEARRQEFIT